MEYSKNSIYIVGCAKAAAENPIILRENDSKWLGQFFLGDGL